MDAALNTFYAAASLYVTVRRVLFTFHTMNAQKLVDYCL